LIPKSSIKSSYKSSSLFLIPKSSIKSSYKSSSLF
jgi:hypothetical protein